MLLDLVWTFLVFVKPNNKKTSFFSILDTCGSKAQKNQIFAKLFLINSDFLQAVNKSTALQKKCRNFPFFLPAAEIHKNAFEIFVNAAEGRSKTVFFYCKESRTVEGWEKYDFFRKKNANVPMTESIATNFHKKVQRTFGC